MSLRFVPPPPEYFPLLYDRPLKVTHDALGITFLSHGEENFRGEAPCREAILHGREDTCACFFDALDFYEVASVVRLG